MAVAASDPVTFNPYAHDVHDDPYPHYARLRKEAPVYQDEEHGFWLLTKWEDCYAAFRDFKTFSSIEGPALEADQNTKAGYPMFINMDPPNHTAIRKMMAPLMVPQRIALLEDYTRNKARELLQPHLKNGKIDLIEDFSGILPMDVISTMIHVKPEDQAMVRGWADDMIYREDGEFGISERTINGYFNVAKYFDKLATELAIEPHNPDDMFSCILQAEREGKLTHEEVIGFGILLAVAGNETTTKLIGNMAFRLWQHPDQRRLLVADPSLIAGAVEETLRYDGSTQMIGRTAMRDVEIRGKKIKKGDRVGLCIISASRDEDRYENADDYDVLRGARDHMAFGAGIHACLGSALARLEVRVCFEEILKVMPEYELDLVAADRTHNPNVRGYTTLPATFTPIH